MQWLVIPETADLPPTHSLTNQHRSSMQGDPLKGGLIWYDATFANQTGKSSALREANQGRCFRSGLDEAVLAEVSITLLGNPQELLHPLLNH